jgi:hypothetical protein
MNKKIFLLGVVLLIAGQFAAAQEWKLITLTADGTETTYALPNVQNIVFKDNSMTVNLKSGDSAAEITCIRFDQSQGIKTLQLESSILVFPNPVQTNLTVTGVDKDVKINLLSLKGTLLQSIPAQDKSTNINVSSLSPGLYLLQIGEQVIKFIKQ